MSRINRKDRTDIIIKSKGGIFDLIDNTIKEIWRINDDEYDFIISEISDSELSLLINETPTISEAKKTLTFIDKKLLLYKKDRKK